jgi:hypothetical protein
MVPLLKPNTHVRVYLHGATFETAQKKSVRIRPIRPIRSPIVSPPSKAEMADKLKNLL